MKIILRTIGIAVLILAVFMLDCAEPGTRSNRLSASDTTGIILINQVGFSPSAVKIALIRVDAEKFEIVEVSSGKVVFTGRLGIPEYWSFSGDSVRVADFSPVTTPGRYRLCLAGTTSCSAEFIIGKNVYNDLAKASIKAFYFNRSGFRITQEFGTKWARFAGHPDTAVIIHESAASTKRPAGTVISIPGGWYDAGDYNKYIVNSGITTYTLLLFYQLYPEYCNSLILNIPESSNNIPDVVDELLYNLNWMLTMQDPDDGGVYHKLTNKEFGGFEMPDMAKESRDVVQKTTAATLDFVSVMAMASRVFENNGNEQLRNLSERCHVAAGKAMKWAEAHPDILYRQPQDIKTGEYGDKRLDDELFWAKVELSLTGNDPSLLEAIDVKKLKVETPSWNQVEMLGIISLALSENPVFIKRKNEASAVLIAFADTLLAKYKSSAYHVSLDYFRWGSNSDVANQAMLKLIALKLSGDKQFMAAIQSDVDYILGRNATAFCFVTGFGDHSPMHIHHRPSAADGVPEPVPGFLAGGPNTNVLNDCGEAVKRSLFPAKSYIDSDCSYSTNEIAINWNAPLFFMMGAMDEMAETAKRKDP
jgi:endoglucanase